MLIMNKKTGEASFPSLSAKKQSKNKKNPVN
jgi:hypothetical protein